MLGLICAACPKTAMPSGVGRDGSPGGCGCVSSAGCLWLLARVPAPLWGALRSCGGSERGTWRPCRGGEPDSCTSGPSPRSRTSGRRGRASKSSAVGELLEDVRDDGPVSARWEAAHVAVADGRHPHPLPGRCCAPRWGGANRPDPRDGTASTPRGARRQGAEGGARHVGQDAVEAARPPRRAGPVGRDPQFAPHGSRPVPWPPRPARCGCFSRARAVKAPRSAARGASGAALAARPGTSVQPAPVRPVRGCGGQHERDELAALVLHARARFFHRVDGFRARRTSLSRHRVRRPAPRYGGLSRPAQLIGRSRRPGRAARVTSEPLVVRGQQLLYAGLAPRRPVPQRGDDPARMRVRGAARWSSGPRSWGGATLSSHTVEIVPRRSLAQHGVDRTCTHRSRARPAPKLHSSGHGGVARDPVVEQLVDSEAEHVRHRRVDLPAGPKIDAVGVFIVCPVPRRRSVRSLPNSVARAVTSRSRSRHRVPRLAQLSGGSLRGWRTRPARRRPQPAPRRARMRTRILLGPAVRLTGFPDGRLLAHEEVLGVCGMKCAHQRYAGPVRRCCGGAGQPPSDSRPR